MLTKWYRREIGCAKEVPLPAIPGLLSASHGRARTYKAGDRLDKPSQFLVVRGTTQII